MFSELANRAFSTRSGDRHTLGLALSRRQGVDLGCHDEVVLVQTVDLVRVEFDRATTPAEVHVRVVSLRLGEGADPVDEGQSFGEVPELETALDARPAGIQRPARCLPEILPCVI